MRVVWKLWFVIPMHKQNCNMNSVNTTIDYIFLYHTPIHMYNTLFFSDHQRYGFIHTRVILSRKKDVLSMESIASCLANGIFMKHVSVVVFFAYLSDYFRLIYWVDICYRLCWESKQNKIHHMCVKEGMKYIN